MPQFPEFFLQFPERIIKQITFSKKISSSECFICRRGMQFWKPRGNNFVKKSQIFRPMFENGQIFISPSFLFQKGFCNLKMLWRTHRRQFWQPLWNFQDERPKNYLYVQKCINKNVSLFKIHFPPEMFLCTHIDCIFDNLNQKLCRKAKNFCSMSKIGYKSQFFQWMFFLKMVLRTRRMKFWQLRQRILTKGQFFLLKVQNCWKIEALSEFFSPK